MIKLVVTDLDNTLYDWVGYYVPALDAMIAEMETGKRDFSPENLAELGR